MGDLAPVIGVSVIFISISWLINKVVSRRALHRERIRYIENGGEPKDLLEDTSRNNQAVSTSFDTLKYGLVAIGLSLGTLLGSILAKFQIVNNEEVSYIFSISLFVGIALVLSHYLIKNKKE